MTHWTETDLTYLAGIQEQVQNHENRKRAQVTFLRERGCPWSEIAAQLGVTKQAAQQRYGQPRPPS